MMYLKLIPGFFLAWMCVGIAAIYAYGSHILWVTCNPTRKPSLIQFCDYLDRVAERWSARAEAVEAWVFS